MLLQNPFGRCSCYCHSVLFTDIYTASFLQSNDKLVEFLFPLEHFDEGETVLAAWVDEQKVSFSHVPSPHFLETNISWLSQQMRLVEWVESLVDQIIRLNNHDKELNEKKAAKLKAAKSDGDSGGTAAGESAPTPG